MTKHAVVSMAFQFAGDRTLVAHACADADVVSFVELRTRKGTSIALASLLPDGWATSQDLSSPEKAATAVAWRSDVFELVEAHDPLLLSRAGRGVRARYLAHVDLRKRATGKVRTYGAAHAPLLATGRKGEWMQTLTGYLRRHPDAEVAGDGNTGMRRLAENLGRPVVGREVMFVAVPVDCTATATGRIVPNTDHPIVSADVRDKPDKEKPAMAYPAPEPTYVGPVRHTGGKNNKPIKRIVIHGTTGAGACTPGYARKIADYFKRTSRPASCHYIVDPAETLQAVYDSVVAYHAPPNTGSLGIEMCDSVEGPRERWSDKNHRAVLDRTARLTAQLCLAYDVPVKFVGAASLKAGERGITTHLQVGKAWGQTSHWDPGAWPRHRFMTLVRAYVEDLTADAATAPAKPTNTVVRRARLAMADALDLLAKAHPGRRRVHQIREDLRDLRDRLPEE